jgi:hypothetical protein
MSSLTFRTLNQCCSIENVKDDNVTTRGCARIMEAALTEPHVELSRQSNRLSALACSCSAVQHAPWHIDALQYAREETFAEHTLMQVCIPA